MQKTISPKFGNLLKSLREERCLTQQKMADLANIDRNYVYYLESGRADPSLTVLRNLSAALGLNFSEFAQKIDVACTQNTN